MAGRSFLAATYSPLAPLKGRGREAGCLGPVGAVDKGTEEAVVYSLCIPSQDTRNGASRASSSPELS